MERVPFNIPPYIGFEQEYIQQVIQSRKICGDGCMTKACDRKIEEMTGVKKSLLTTSGSTALDMAAILSGIGPEDEVIMPSFTFCQRERFRVARGDDRFVDIRPDTMNLTIEDERAITKRTECSRRCITRAFTCEMDTIMALAERYRLLVWRMRRRA